MWCFIEMILLVLVGVLVKLIGIPSHSNENSRSEAPEKISNELNEQNMILHSTLEEHGLAGNSSRNVDKDAGLQNVVEYLRRTKEIAETGVSLLEQEKLRLQAQVTEINLLRESNTQLMEEKKHHFDECQKLLETSKNDKAEIEKLETMLAVKEKDVTDLKKEKEHLERRVDELDIAMKTAETSQASLRAERDEEFKSLQLQLRKSNDQLGEEKKNYFDECQKLLETSQKARTEIEKLEAMLAVKEKDVTDLKKEKEKLKMEKERIERRVDEIFEVTEVSGAYADAYIYLNKDKVIVMEIKDDSTSSVATHKILRKASVQLFDHTVVYSVRASEINRLSPQYQKGIGVMVIREKLVGWIDAQTVARNMNAKKLATTINNLAS